MLAPRVHPAAIPRAVSCTICNLSMFVSDALGDHMVEAYSSTGLVIALYVASMVSLCLLSTPCRYDIRMGPLLVRSWARVQRASLETCRCISLPWLRCRRCVCTMLVCICVESAEICCRATESGCASTSAVQPMLLNVVFLLSPGVRGWTVSLCSWCVGCCAFRLTCDA